MKINKITILLIACMISSEFMSAQQINQKKSTKSQTVKAGFGVSVVQTQPEFPGGQENLIAFIDKNISYPKNSRLSGVEGKVFIGFLVTKEGKIQDARVLSSINDELDGEALRVIQLMPDWKPGYKGGVAVDVQYILPVEFILPKRS